MLLVDATAEDVAKMNERLHKKRIDKKAEEEMDQVVNMVQKHPFVAAPEITEEPENFQREEMFFNAIGTLMLSIFGAILWNVYGSKIGLAAFFILFAVSIRKFKYCFT